MFLFGAVEYLSPFSTILGPIVWSLTSGTEHRGTFVVPISYLIKSENVHFFWLLSLFASEAILDFHFLEITSLLGLFNLKRQNRQDRAYRIELADLRLNFRR